MKVQDDLALQREGETRAKLPAVGQGGVEDLADGVELGGTDHGRFLKPPGVARARRGDP
jgi:hypothetical protein